MAYKRFCENAKGISSLTLENIYEQSEYAENLEQFWNDQADKLARPCKFLLLEKLNLLAYKLVERNFVQKKTVDKMIQMALQRDKEREEELLSYDIWMDYNNTFLHHVLNEFENSLCNKISLCLCKLQTCSCNRKNFNHKKNIPIDL
jgi:hypothetical protein